MAKYSGAGTKTDVRAETDSKSVRISVADTGRGIAKEEILSLFDRYYRRMSSDDVAGTDIGLHLVQALVNIRGGKITINVESEVGKGPTSTEDLPVSLRESVASEDQNGPELAVA